MEARALVGRERELRALETALASVARGQRGLLMLSGEAGIGKTRLLEELATRVVAQGGIATWGRMWEVGLTPAFWPFIQVLSALHAPLQATPSLDTLEERADASARLSRFGEVARFLGRRAEERPLAILLDDLHMADPSSLQLLEYLLPLLLNKPVLFALAARDGDARADVAAALGRIQRGALRLELRPLEVGAVETLVAGRADFRRVFELSEGNPLFVEELLASGSLQLPKLSSVRTVIRERVAALPAESVTTLIAASVVGREFSAQVVAHMIGRAEVGAQLQPVRASGMLSMTAPDRYRFSHALVAEAIADELDPSERARLHLRAAQALERHDALDTSAIAHHLLAAGHLAAEAAITASERAARTCLAQLAFEDAAALLAGALHALSLAAPTDRRRRAELLCSRAEALQHASRHKEAAELCDEAAQLTRTLLRSPLPTELTETADAGAKSSAPHMAGDSTAPMQALPPTAAASDTSASNANAPGCVAPVLLPAAAPDGDATSSTSAPTAATQALPPTAAASDTSASSTNALGRVAPVLLPAAAPDGAATSSTSAPTAATQALPPTAAASDTSASSTNALGRVAPVLLPAAAPDGAATSSTSAPTAAMQALPPTAAASDTSASNANAPGRVAPVLLPAAAPDGDATSSTSAPTAATQALPPMAAAGGATTSDADGARTAVAQRALAVRRSEGGLERGIVPSADAAELLARIALVRGLEFRFGRTDPLLVSLLREAIAALGVGRHAALRARLLARLAAAEQPARDPQEPVARALEAIALAAELEPADRMDVMYVASAALIDYIEPSVLERIQQEVLALARGRDRSISIHTRLRLCFTALDRVDRSTYDAAVVELSAEANALGLARWTRQVHTLAALTALFEGRFKDAQLAAAELERSLASIAEDGTRFSLDVHRVMYAWVTTTPVDHTILARIADYAPGRLAIAAWIAVQEGQPERARQALAQLAGRLPVDPDMGAMVATAIAYVDDATFAEQALATLSERSGRIVLTSMVGFAVMDLYDRLLMLLARAAKRWDLIDGYAERAIEVARKLGSPVWAARVRSDWADALEARASAADSGKKSAVASAGAPAAAMSGGSVLLITAKSPPAPVDSATHTPALDVERARERRALALAEAERLGMPGLLQHCRARSEGARAPNVPQVQRVGLQLERAGELWTLRGLGELVHVKSSRGMELLARLIAEPLREWHVLDLAGASAADGGDAGPHLDVQAREAYRVRARELTQERDEAEASADLGRVERAQRELDALSAELERAFGLGGRERRAGAASERARSNVQRRISHAIAQIREASPTLGQHLAQAIRTGTYCAYEPKHT